MFEQFTVRARKVLKLSNEEARRLDNDYVGTDHILRGLVKEGGGAAADVLKNLGVELNAIVSQLEKLDSFDPRELVNSLADFLAKQGTPMTEEMREYLLTTRSRRVGLFGSLVQTPRAKKVVENAMEEARIAHCKYVTTGHILLGLLREDEGVAAQVLMNVGLRLETLRAAIAANSSRLDTIEE
jgi:ATP-dependent Clp protease ATP-binding subunit ClpC